VRTDSQLHVTNATIALQPIQKTLLRRPKSFKPMHVYCLPVLWFFGSFPGHALKMRHISDCLPGAQQTGFIRQYQDTRSQVDPFERSLTRTEHGLCH
jgi:hypothetical protein